MNQYNVATNSCHLSKIELAWSCTHTPPASCWSLSTPKHPTKRSFVLKLQNVVGGKQHVTFVDSSSNVVKIAYTKYSVMPLYEQIIAWRNCTRLTTQGNSSLAYSKKVPCSDNHIREKRDVVKNCKISLLNSNISAWICWEKMPINLLILLTANPI